MRNGHYSAQNLVDFSTMTTGGARLAPINLEVAGGIPSNLLAHIEAKRTEISSGRFQVPVDDSEPPASTAVNGLP